MATRTGKPGAVARPAVVAALAALGFTQRGDEWSGCCPRPDHDDASPSFGYNQQKDTFNCFGCEWTGTGADLAATLGVTAEQAGRDHRGRDHGGDGVAPASPRRAKLGRIDDTYDYTDEAGTLLFQVVRYAPKNFRQRRPGAGTGLARGWIADVTGVRRVPYRLRELLDGISRGDRVFLCEGEKDANTLRALGYVATAVAGGANAWLDEYTQYFAGGDVTILPDHDTQGYGFGVAAATSLLRAGVRVRWCSLPKDVSDWLTRHTPEALRAALDAALVIATDAEIPADPHRPGIVALDVGAGDLDRWEIRPRDVLLSPWLETQGTALMYGPPGVGKSRLAIGAATAIATGTAMGTWRAPTAAPVLFIDGEMQGHRVREIFGHALAAVPDGGRPAPGYLRLVTPDAQPELFAPNLADETAQRLLAPLIAGVKVVFIDNVSTLWRADDENAASSWNSMQTWLLGLRQRGVAVVLVHHSGKSGDQLGTSKRTIAVDTVIKLGRPDGYDQAEGARFVVEYEKARGFRGPEAARFEARLIDDAGGLPHWAFAGVHDQRVDALRTAIVELRTKGIAPSIRALEDHTGLKRSTIQRLRTRLDLVDADPPGPTAGPRPPRRKRPPTRGTAPVRRRQILISFRPVPGVPPLTGCGTLGQRRA